MSEDGKTPTIHPPLAGTLVDLRQCGPANDSRAVCGEGRFINGSDAACTRCYGHEGPHVAHAGPSWENAIAIWWGFRDG